MRLLLFRPTRFLSCVECNPGLPQVCLPCGEFQTLSAEVARFSRGDEREALEQAIQILSATDEPLDLGCIFKKVAELKISCNIFAVRWLDLSSIAISIQVKNGKSVGLELWVCVSRRNSAVGIIPKPTTTRFGTH